MMLKAERTNDKGQGSPAEPEGRLAVLTKSAAVRKREPVRALGPRPSRPRQALQSHVEIITLARQPGRSRLFRRSRPDDGGEDSKEVRVPLGQSLLSSLRRGRTCFWPQCGETETGFRWMLAEPTPGVRAGRVCDAPDTHTQHACADSVRAAGTPGVCGHCVGRTPASGACPVGPPSCQEEGGLEEVTGAVTLLPSA